MMVSLKKCIPCKCGANNSFEFASDMSIEDLTLTARCPSCGASIAISVSALLSTATLSSPSPTPMEQAVGEHVDADTKANVEQAVRDLFR